MDTNDTPAGRALNRRVVLRIPTVSGAGPDVAPYASHRCRWPDDEDSVGKTARPRHDPDSHLVFSRDCVKMECCG